MQIHLNAYLSQNLVVWFSICTSCKRLPCYIKCGWRRDRASHFWLPAVFHTHGDQTQTLTLSAAGWWEGGQTPLANLRKAFCDPDKHHSQSFICFLWFWKYNMLFDVLNTLFQWYRSGRVIKPLMDFRWSPVLPFHVADSGSTAGSHTDQRWPYNFFVCRLVRCRQGATGPRWTGLVKEAYRPAQMKREQKSPAAFTLKGATVGRPVSRTCR